MSDALLIPATDVQRRSDGHRFRSVFIGHSAAVTDPLQVSQYLDSLLQDKKVAKATHPTIYAYRIVRETHSAPLKEPVIIAGEQPVR